MVVKRNELVQLIDNTHDTFLSFIGLIEQMALWIGILTSKLEDLNVEDGLVDAAQDQLLRTSTQLDVLKAIAEQMKDAMDDLSTASSE